MGRPDCSGNCLSAISGWSVRVWPSEVQLTASTDINRLYRDQTLPSRVIQNVADCGSFYAESVISGRNRAAKISWQMIRPQQLSREHLSHILYAPDLNYFVAVARAGVLMMKIAINSC
jgi:hypothetical protein